MPFNQENIMRAGKVAALNSVSARFLYNDDLSVQGFVEDAGASIGSTYISPMVQQYINNMGLDKNQVNLLSNIVGDVAASYLIDQVTETREPLMEKAVKFAVSEYVLNFYHM